MTTPFELRMDKRQNKTTLDSVTETIQQYKNSASNSLANMENDAINALRTAHNKMKHELHRLKCELKQC